MTETKQGGGGKGRPTPKRSEAQRRKRGPVTPAPTDRRSAARARRAAAVERRAAAVERRAEMRRALREGDERLYPPAHAGPERRFVRQVVDGRRGVAWAVLPGWLTLTAVSLAPVLAVRAFSSLGLLALVGLAAGDSVSTAFTVRRRLAAEFPDGTKEPRGRLVRYAIARNAAMRRFRTPRPTPPT